MEVAAGAEHQSDGIYPANPLLSTTSLIDLLVGLSCTFTRLAPRTRRNSRSRESSQTLASKTEVITTKTIRDLLRGRYLDTRWILAFEVGNSTGMDCYGYADAIAMHQWPSRDYVIHGFEFKTSRADWLRELKKPEKSGRFQSHVDFWWIVAPAEVVLESELPEKWGLMKVTPNRVAVKHDASRLHPTQDMDRGFAASLLRKYEPENPIFKEIVEKQVDKRERILKEDFDRELRQHTNSLKDTKKFIKTFEEVFGRKFSGWWGDVHTYAHELKLAIQLVKGINRQQVKDLARLLQGLASRAAELEETLSEQQDPISFRK